SLEDAMLLPVMPQLGRPAIPRRTKQLVFVMRVILIMNNLHLMAQTCDCLRQAQRLEMTSIIGSTVKRQYSYLHSTNQFLNFDLSTFEMGDLSSELNATAPRAATATEMTPIHRWTSSRWGATEPTCHPTAPRIPPMIRAS